MKLRETETVELKEQYTAGVKNAIIAFSTSNDRPVYIGVSDDGRMIGIEETASVIEQLSNAIRDGIRPDLAMFTEIEQIENEGKSLIRVTVQQGTKRPYYLSERGLRPSGVYLRSGTSSAPASGDSIRRLIKMTDGDSFESNRSLDQDLTFHSLAKVSESRKLELSEIQMENLGLMTSDQLFTNLGLLVSDQCRHTIKFAVFQGEDKEIFKDRKELIGSLFTQLEDSYRLIDFYNSTKATFHDLLRTDRRDFPQGAIREVLLNAIIHRDYTFSGSTLINLFSDRFEIISLGGLVPGLSLEAAMIVASQSRNEKLAALFYRFKLVEAFGTGINKILKAYEKSDSQPHFESVEGAFKVTLPNMNRPSAPPQAAGLVIQDTLQMIEEERFAPVLNLFTGQREITRRDVENSMNIKTTQAINTLKEMLEKEYLIKVGDGRNTRYLKNPGKVVYRLK